MHVCPKVKDIQKCINEVRVAIKISCKGLIEIVEKCKILILWPPSLAQRQAKLILEVWM